jgi:hypothetical protein
MKQKVLKLSVHEDARAWCSVSAPADRTGLPIWISALLASNCRANGISGSRTVQWECVDGRAKYTNHGSDTCRIDPLGVSLESGHTLSVAWLPNGTAYTLEVVQAK